MRPLRTLSLVLALVTLGPALARAQMGALGALGGGGGQKSLTFGIGGGVAVPVSDANEAFKTGFNGMAYARYQLPGMPIGFGVSVAFHRFDMKDAVVQSTPGATSGKSTLLAGLGDLKYDLIRGPIRPYLIVGLGAYNVQTTIEGAGSSPSKTQFGVNGGLGVSAKLGAIRGFVQGRLDNVFTEKGAIDAKQIQVVPVTVGLEF